MVAEAENGMQLLNLLKHIKPDVILLDIQMPIMDGFATLPEIKKLYPDVKVIMLSMHNDHSIITRMMEVGADVVVAEAGASPLEPYNGATAIAEIEKNVRCTLLCASDPYGVVGVSTAFKRQPNLVAGAAANTDAGIQLVEKLSGLKALDLLDKRSLPQLRTILKETLGF